MDNILHSSLSIFHSFFLWVCGLGIAAIALAYAGYLLARFLGEVRRSIRTYGLPTVIALAALMVFATIEGTPTNASKLRMENAEWRMRGANVECRMENEACKVRDSDILHSPLSILHSDYAAGIVLSQIGTDETHSFEPIPGADVCDDWRRFGAARDWFRCKWKMENEEWRMVLGTNLFDAVTVFSYGTVRLSMTNLTTFVSPFRADIGIVPQANWSLLSPITRYQSPTTNDDILHSPFSILHSQFWQALTPSNTFVMCWQNVPWNRDVHYPFSFMIEFEEKGDITFRYDLTNVKWRMENGEWVENSVLSNVCVGVMNNGLGRAFNALPTNVTSLKFAHLDPTRADDPDPDGDGLTTDDEVLVHHTDPYDADTDKDGLSDGREVNETHTDPLDPHSLDPRYPDGVAIEIGEQNPFDSPEGSEHTYWEHLFYTGTTNAPFAYPQSTTDTAVLRVSVSGEGAGELVVGDMVVPLLAIPSYAPMSVDEDGAGESQQAPTNTLLVAVGRGVVKRLWYRKPEGLQLAIDSDDLLIGEMPIAVIRPGWIAFPHTDATLPCIHDLEAGEKEVTLVHGEEFPGLTATWSSEANGVVITNNPPVSATVYGRFAKSETRSISYGVWHPDILNSNTNIVFTQEMRFCPRLTEEEDVSQGNLDDDPQDEAYYWCLCTDGQPCTCCSGEWCHCPYYQCPCNAEHHATISTNDVVAVAAYTNMMSEAFVDANNILRLCRDERKAIELIVPSPSERVCCPCPDHHEGTYASAVSGSHRVEIQHSDGSRFSITNRSGTVYAKGISPSRAPNDSSVYFVTNGVVSKTLTYTVLGVGFETCGNRPSLFQYNELSSELGYPITINTNICRATTLRVRSEVLLDSGVVRLGLENVEGEFAIHLPEWWDNSGNSHPPEKILDSAQRTERYFTMRQWRNVMRRYGNSREQALLVTSSITGRVDLVVDYVATNGSCRIRDSSRQRVTSIQPLLLADCNRDGVLDDDDIRASLSKFYFWTNKDFWQDDDGPDDSLWDLIQGANRPNNGDDDCVNGRNDIVNLLPLAIRPREIARYWGVNNITVKIRTSQGNVVRRCYADLPWDNMKKGLLEDIDVKDESSWWQITYRPHLRTAKLRTLDWDGDVLSQEEISRSLSSVGAIYLEGMRYCEDPIEIVVLVGGEEMFSYKPEIQFSDIDTMYRWRNIRSGFAQTTTEGDYLYGRPNCDESGKQLVFVHGYNVNEREAVEWGRTVFRRLWWSGYDGGFTVVAWNGNQGQKWAPTQGLITPDYQVNVENAFNSSSNLAAVVNALPGSKHYVMAHSLGNMITSAAIQDWGLVCERYFMLNAAVPIEAFDAQGGVTDVSSSHMTPAMWSSYTNRVRATHWHQMFSSNDSRRSLSWRGRFASVQNTVNYFSSEEEVLANGDGTEADIGRELAWYYQETHKGRKPYVPIYGTGRNEGGWAFNAAYDVLVEHYIDPDGFDYCRYEHMSPTDAALLSEPNLIASPFFSPFEDSAICRYEDGSYTNMSYALRAQLLADAIPALSYAVGRNRVAAWDSIPLRNNLGARETRNEDMVDYKDANMIGILSQDVNAGKRKWVHTFFITKPYAIVHSLYEDIVTRIKNSGGSL